MNFLYIFIIFCTVKNKYSSELISHSRVVRKSVYFQEGYSEYLCFNVIIGSNNLIPEQENHDLIKLLHDKGMGYRKIAQYLNEKGIKTARGNSWVNTQVFSVLKRFKQRQDRIKNVRMKEHDIEIGKFELQWIKDST